MKSLRLLALLGVLSVAGLPALSNAQLPPCPGSCSQLIGICLGVCGSPPHGGATGQQCMASDGSVKDVAYISCPYCLSAACVYP